MTCSPTRHPHPPHIGTSAQANAITERWIGTFRRELLDRMLILNAATFRRELLDRMLILNAATSNTR
jgi:hypothetical protein